MKSKLVCIGSFILGWVLSVNAAISIVSGPTTVNDDAETGEMVFSDIAVQAGDMVAIASAPNKDSSKHLLSLSWSGTEGVDGTTTTIPSGNFGGRACYVYYVDIATSGTYTFTVSPAASDLTAQSSLFILRADSGAISVEDTQILTENTASPGLDYTFSNALSNSIAIESFASKSGKNVTVDSAYNSVQNGNGRFIFWSTSVQGTAWNPAHTCEEGAQDFVGAGVVFAEQNLSPLPPTFNQDPILKPDATEQVAYSGTLLGDASDPNGDPMTFFLSATNTWLSLAPNGDLSGTPGAGDVGTNQWTVFVTDGISGTNSATLQIKVIAQQPPIFNDDPILSHGARTNFPYSGSLASMAEDPNGDPISFGKLSGPAWLNVSGAGDLSGTPQSSDLGTNEWSVFVTDGISGTNSSTLQIVVNAKPNYTNIVLIVIDDLGWMDLSIQGSEFYETPRIDELAQSGMRFTQGYAAHPRCLPSRYGLMTGRFPGPSGVPAGPDGLVADEVTIGEALQQAGYETFFAGKWHISHEIELLPQNQGFGINITGGAPGSPPSYFFPYGEPVEDETSKTGLYLDNSTPVGGMVTDRITGKSYRRTFHAGEEGEYITDRLTDEALDWLEWNADKPIFLYMSHYGVHTPFEAPDELVSKYEAKLATMDYGDLPEEIPSGCGYQKMRQDHPTYAAMIESVDTNIGRLIDKLEELGLSENTFIIFTSDNGGLSNRGAYNTRELATSNYPLRTGKGWLYEGGIREAFIVKGPGVATMLNTNAVINGTDIYPTILDMAGVPLRPLDHRNGVSFKAALDGSPYDRGEPIFWHSPKARPYATGDFNSSALRDGDYKLIWWFDTPGRNNEFHCELYNVQADPGETNDLAQTMPTKVEELLGEIKSWHDHEHWERPEGPGVTQNPDDNDIGKPPHAYLENRGQLASYTVDASAVTVAWSNYPGYEASTLYSRTNLTEGSWTVRATGGTEATLPASSSDQEFLKLELGDIEPEN